MTIKYISMGIRVDETKKILHGKQYDIYYIIILYYIYIIELIDNFIFFEKHTKTKRRFVTS